MTKHKTKYGYQATQQKESHRRIYDFFGLVLIFFSLCTVLSVLSYSPKDPSWLVASEESVQNMVGFLGSYWASLLLEVFGAATLAICLLLFVLSFSLFWAQKITGVLLSIMGHSFMIVLTSLALSLTEKSFTFYGKAFPMGGYLGKSLGTFLQSHLNVGGSILFTSLCFFFSLSLITQSSVQEMLLHGYKLLIKVFILSLALFFYVLERAKSIARYVGKFIYWSKEKLGESIKRRIEKRKKIPIYEQGLGTEEKAKLFSYLENKPFSTKHRTDHMDSEIHWEEEDPNTEEIEIIEKTDSSSHYFHPEQEKNLSLGARTRTQKIIGKILNYSFPPFHLLRTALPKASQHNREELLANSRLLEQKLSDFRIKGNVTAVKPGPVITMYEFRPGIGVKLSSIASLADDLALALSAESVRIEAPIPGRDIVGIEVPNKNREEVYLKEIIDTELFKSQGFSIPIAIGKDTMGEAMVTDLKKMPHLLVAGTTGSGKSVFINTVICSLLYRFPPNELKMILVDPKQLELNSYEAIPHLLLPVVTEAKKASLALRWAVEEMEKRYQRIALSGMRDVDSYNKRLKELGKEAFLNRPAYGARKLDPEQQKEIDFIPKIVIVIDELADLMMNAKTDVENNICRLAQKARAAGIHLILATQRPSVDVITGLIKANLPARISFRLSSKNDSRTVFDVMGAERLVGNGDMLFMTPGESRLVRMHGAYVSEMEIEEVAQFWRDQGEPEYCEEILLEPEEEEDGFSVSEEGDDKLFQNALDLTVSTGYVSASMLQRRFRIGYNRAARIVEAMEARGIVGPADGSKPRPCLLTK